MSRETTDFYEDALRRILRQMDEVYDAEGWHGPNLRGSLRRVPLDEICWRSDAGAHNIWEIALHSAYWKHVVLSKMKGTKRFSFPAEGRDWYTRPAPDLTIAQKKKAWQDDLAILDNTHRELRAAVTQLTPMQWDTVVYGEMVLTGFITGVIAHDVYHAGQIQFIRQQFKRLQKTNELDEEYSNDGR